MSSVRHDAEMPREENQAPLVNGDQTFREAKWEYLHSIAETPRYAAVAGYVHKLLRQGDLLDAGCGEGLHQVGSQTRKLFMVACSSSLPSTQVQSVMIPLPSLMASLPSHEPNVA